MNRKRTCLIIIKNNLIKTGTYFHKPHTRINHITWVATFYKYCIITIIKNDSNNVVILNLIQLTLYFLQYFCYFCTPAPRTLN